MQSWEPKKKLQTYFDWHIYFDNSIFWLSTQSKWITAHSCKFSLQQQSIYFATCCCWVNGFNFVKTRNSTYKYNTMGNLLTRCFISNYNFSSKSRKTVRNICSILCFFFSSLRYLLIAPISQRFLHIWLWEIFSWSQTQRRRAKDIWKVMFHNWTTTRASERNDPAINRTIEITKWAKLSESVKTIRIILQRRSRVFRWLLKVI